MPRKHQPADAAKTEERLRDEQIERQREDFLAREAEAMTEWQQPAAFVAEHNACPWMDDEQPAETEQPEAVETEPPAAE